MHIIPSEHLSAFNVESAQMDSRVFPLSQIKFISCSFSDGCHRPVGTGKESGRFVQNGSMFWGGYDCRVHSGRPSQQSLRVSATACVWMSRPHLPPPSARFLNTFHYFWNISCFPGRESPPASVLQAASWVSCWSWSSSPKTPKLTLQQPTPTVSHTSDTPTMIRNDCNIIQMLRLLTLGSNDDSFYLFIFYLASALEPVRE